MSRLWRMSFLVCPSPNKRQKRIHKNSATASIKDEPKRDNFDGSP